MKSKNPRRKGNATKAQPNKTVSDALVAALRSARRGSAYAFVAGLGIWLPRANAATLVNLDATTHPLGALNVWTNTGSLSGDFTVPVGATSTPTNVVVDGVQGIFFEGGGDAGGAAGSHYVGPTAPTSVVSSNARTVEAWIFNTNSVAEHNVFSYGRREGAGGFAYNNSFGHGTDPAFGAVGMFLAADLGWGNNASQVATNRVVNRWTYIVQSFDGTNNAVYVDGRLANSEGRPATALINTAAVANDLTTPLPFRVARQNTAAGAISGAGDQNIIIGRIRVQDVAMNATSISNQFFIEKDQFNLKDTDNDGMPDWWEERYSLQKNNSADAIVDGDADGLTNLQEFQNNTNPGDSDSDDDGALDGAEVNRTDIPSGNPAPTNPLDADSDDDGLMDGIEDDSGVFNGAGDPGTDPLKGDTDGDIVSDGAEVTCGTDPNNPAVSCSIARAIELDATGVPTGPLTNWTNTGFIAGNFSVPTNATVPSVITRDGVKGVGLQSTPAGANGTHYFGPATTAEVTGASPRTVEAWVFDTVVQDEKIIIAWGGRNTGNGTDYPFGIGGHNTWGAVAAWGDPDIGWNDQEVHGRWTHVATTWDGTTTRLYSEGVLVNSESVPISTLLTAPNDGQPYHFRIGRQNGNTTFDSIDNTGEGEITIGRVRVYTNALDGATIKARFDSEKADFGLNDSDGDGLPNWYEIRWGLNPNSDVGNDGAGGDPDADTLTNLQEYQLGTGATDADTDDDGLNDNAELTRVDAGLPLPPTGSVAPTNPLNPDTDGDGLLDGVETDTGIFAGTSNTGTDPLRVDTDGDTFSDGVEVSQGSNPTLASSVPSGDPVINLIATNLPAGPLTNWVNSGTFSNGFAFASANATVPSVQFVQGINAVRFPGPAAGNPFYTGPTNPAAANVTGNKTYSVEAWVHNEGLMGEEVVIAWGRRGTDGLNSSFSHGTSLDFGCMGHWGGQDLGYGGAGNVIENRWTHIVYTYNANTLVQNAFVDGVQVNTETLGAALAIADVGTGGSAPFRVGAQNVGGGGPSGVGRADRLSIGELRVYTLNLSPAEVMNKFNTGAELYGITDKDGDGIPSWFERTYPGCMDENVLADGGADCDTDGLSNLGEFQAGTNPLIADTDGDGLSDGDEVNTRGTNPSNKDTDQDGLTDNREIALSANPLAPDTDSDGVADSTEVVYGTNPNDVGSVPSLSPPVPFVSLDATGLPAGPLMTWSNLNALGWTFVAPSNAVANVESVEGTKGVTFFTTNHYEGPNIPTFFGGDASRTVEAWIYNPTRQNEETVFAWGARGTDGRNSAFSHGADLGFGALQFWGAAADVPWGTNAAQVAQNVVTSRWTHVAYVYDNVSKQRACFADGVLAYSETDTNVLNTFIYDPLDPLNAPPNTFGRTLRFRVGGQNQASGAFDAGAARPTLTIAKVRAYDQALSAAQIAANYNAERVQFPGQPRITNVRVNPANGFVSFDWVPTPGRTYEVLRNSDVANPSGWSSLATGLSSGSYTNDPAGAPRNYYRLRVEPLP